MCGIIGAFTTGEKRYPVNEQVLMQFEDQKKRGTEGFGIIKISEKKKFKVDRATEGYKFMWDIHQDPSPCMILHHRTPTSTKNTIQQTHPIFVSNALLEHDYLVVHNGVISNDDDVWKDHIEKGFIYTTQEDVDEKYCKFNDSETLAIDMALFIEKKIQKLSIKGSFAFIATQLNKKTAEVESIFYGRNTNPLNLVKTRGKVFLSSEGPGNEVKPKILYSFKLDENMHLSHRPLIYDEPSSERSVYDSKPWNSNTSWPLNGYTTEQKKIGFSSPYEQRKKALENVFNDEEDLVTPHHTLKDLDETEEHADNPDIEFEESLNEDSEDIMHHIEDLYIELSYNDPTGIDIEYYLQEVRKIMMRSVERATEHALTKVEE